MILDIMVEYAIGQGPIECDLSIIFIFWLCDSSYRWECLKGWLSYSIQVEDLRFEIRPILFQNW